MKPTQDTQHVTEGLGYLIGRYVDKPNVKGLLTAFLNRIQDIENVLWAVIESQMLATPPTGNALDQLGDLVQEPRGDFNDTQYLTFIKVAIRSRRSGGKAEDILQIAALVFSPFTYNEWPPVSLAPAAFDVVALNIPADYAMPMVRAFHRARPAGVYGVLDYSTWSTALNMTLGDTWGGPAGTGFRDYYGNQFSYEVIAAEPL